MNEPLFTRELMEELEAETPDPQRIRDYIITAYNQNTSSNVELTIAPNDVRLRDIAGWINKCSMDSASGSFFVYRKKAMCAFFSDFSSKVSVLAQYSCPMCTENFPMRFLPIRISPISFQSPRGKLDKKKTQSAYRKAIQQRLQESGGTDFGNKRLCIFITFVLSGRERDLDNMAKALLDALKQSLFTDDDSIDHLSLLKIRSQRNEEYVIVNIRESKVNKHNDVLFHGTHMTW